LKILEGEAWGIITARGGSKSIKLKNIIPIAGKPLIAYNIEAAKKAKTINRIICSTDHEKIAETAKSYGSEVIKRPKELAGDLVPSIDVMIHLVNQLLNENGSVAEILVLLQPTSIFLTADHIDQAVKALMSNPLAKSSQCVVKVPHQFHAHNQREMFDGENDIGFVYEKERERGYSKQTKPVYFAYGNLIVTRAKSIIEDKTFFGRPSIPIEIPLDYTYDLDIQEDIEMAELMLKNNLIKF
jgi:CMP-N,N'-diacetyllegionaminic acid synthase